LVYISLIQAKASFVPGGPGGRGDLANLPEDVVSLDDKSSAIEPAAVERFVGVKKNLRFGPRIVWMR
jgi:hypothetical protein